MYLKALTVKVIFILLIHLLVFKATSKKSNYLLMFQGAGSFYPSNNLLNSIDALISGDFNYLINKNQFFIMGIDYKIIHPYKIVMQEEKNTYLI